MLSLTKTTYRMRMELFQFPGHCLRGGMKLRKSSNTLKTRMMTLKSQMNSTTMLKRTNQKKHHKTNSIPFPQDPAVNDPEDEPPQPQGRPQCTVRYQGNYKGMMAAAAIFDKEDVDKISPEGVESGVGEVSDYLYELPGHRGSGTLQFRSKDFRRSTTWSQCQGVARTTGLMRSISFKSLEPGLWRTYQLVKQPYHAAKS